MALLTMEQNIVETLKNLSNLDIESRWGLNAGQGEAIGNDNDSPSEALARAGYSDIRIFDTVFNLGYNAAGIKNGRIVAVINDNGSWAVDITPES